MKVFISNKVEATVMLGSKLAKTLVKKDVVCLFGSLGAGKTVLTQGICKGLKVRDFVNSPSFKIVNEYRGKFPIYHIDLYRLNSTGEISDLGLDEYIYGNGIAIIEWAEKLGKKNLPKKRFEIYIKISARGGSAFSGTNENEREIKWQRYP